LSEFDNSEVAVMSKWALLQSATKFIRSPGSTRNP